MKITYIIRSVFILNLCFFSLFSTLVRASVPVQEFAQEPDLKNVRLSPNGKYIALMRRIGNGIKYVVEIRSMENLGAKPVILGTKEMEMVNFSWINNNRLLINFRQLVKKANNRSRVSRAATINREGKKKWVSLPDNSSLITLFPKDPQNIIIQYRAKGEQLAHFYTFNVDTGKTKQIFKTNTRFSYGMNQNGNVRVAFGYNSDTNSLETYAREIGGEWKLINNGKSLFQREKFTPMGFYNEKESNEMVIIANRGEKTAGAYTFNIKTGEYKKIFSSPKVDVNVLTMPVPGKHDKIVGITYDYGNKPGIYYLDEDYKKLQQYIDQNLPKTTNRIKSINKDGSLAIIFSASSTEPGSYYLLKNKSKLIFLGKRKPKLKPEDLGKSEMITYKARDGLEIPAILTLPPKGNAPYPTIIMPHGGPWARDHIGYDKWVQLLANHGYAVLQPQYRGSKGFTKTLWVSGDKEWGKKMQDDKDDGASYLIKQGIADKNRIALFGWSYGGYAGFVAAIRPNGLYQCSVAGAGVADLNTARASLFGGGSRARIQKKYQWPTVNGLDPIDHVEEISIPLLVIHGRIDTRVPVAHSRKFVRQLKKYNKNYKYLELKNADHFFGTIPYEQNIIFYNTLLDWLDNTCHLKP